MSRKTRAELEEEAAVDYPLPAQGLVEAARHLLVAWDQPAWRREREERMVPAILALRTALLPTEPTCPNCGQPVAIDESHLDLASAPMAEYTCAAQP